MSLSRGEILNTINNIILDQGGTRSVSVGSTFSSDLGWDKFDFLEFMIDCREEFGVEIPPNVMDKIKRIGDVVEYIHFRLNPKTPNPKFLHKTCRNIPISKGRNASSYVDGNQGKYGKPMDKRKCSPDALINYGWTKEK